MDAKILVITVILILLSGIAISEFYLQSDNQQSENYNVVFVTIEATQADHLGTYGYDRNTSPNLDQFAKNNYVFTNAISPSATTILSMPAVFTSLYPKTDRAVARTPSKADPVWHNNLSLVRQFQENGYHTKAIVSHEYVKSRWDFDKYFDDFDDDFVQEANTSKGLSDPSISNTELSKKDFEFYKKYWEERNAEETTQLANQYIKKNKQPFFLWLHYFDPHSPYMPPEKKYLEMFETPYEGENKTEKYYMGAAYRNVSESRIHNLRNQYDSEIRYTDSQIGNLLETLEKQNLTDETIIVITADHGECVGENNVFDHNELHRCSLHVPLIIHIPEELRQSAGKTGKRIDRPVSTIDIFPTLLQLLNMENNRLVRGESLFSGNHRNYQYAERGDGKQHEYQIFNYGSNNSFQEIKQTRYDNEKIQKEQKISKEVAKRLENLGYKK
jgi:arylsulfatase A-like enzyme